MSDRVHVIPPTARSNRTNRSNRPPSRPRPPPWTPPPMPPRPATGGPPDRAPGGQGVARRAETSGVSGQAVHAAQATARAAVAGDAPETTEAGAPTWSPLSAPRGPAVTQPTRTSPSPRPWRKSSPPWHPRWRGHAEAHGPAAHPAPHQPAGAPSRVAHRAVCAQEPALDAEVPPAGPAALAARSGGEPRQIDGAGSAPSSVRGCGSS